METNASHGWTMEANEAQAADMLAAHHRELDRRLDALITRAQGGDPTRLRAEWGAIERELLRHLELEEAEILPGFAGVDAAGARAILDEHAAIRGELLEMGLNLDLHLLRAERVAAFVDQLRAHSRREEHALYARAQRHVTRGGWQAIARGLRDASHPRG
jgi:hemerythrin-like domain-containing protein